LIAHDTRLRVFVHPADETNRMRMPRPRRICSDCLLRSQISRNRKDSHRRASASLHPIHAVAVVLRHFTQVGFWQPGQQVGEADFYITSVEAADQYADQLRNFAQTFFGVRPGVLILLWSPAPK